jgi:chloramphenicol O-acetyltransferase type A
MMGKRVIDRATWTRRDHFEFFKDFEHPHFDITAPLDVTRTVEYAQVNDQSFFKLVLFLSMKVVHSIPEFRTRIEGGEVVEFERVDVAPTYMPKNRPGLYSNMVVAYDPDYARFVAHADAAMAEQDRQPTMIGSGDRIDVIYASCIPWVSFTSLTNPVYSVRSDSVPRIAWGKYTEEQGVLKMPYTIQLHHGLADAYHAGVFYSRLQESLSEVGRVISYQ